MSKLYKCRAIGVSSTKLKGMKMKEGIYCLNELFGGNRIFSVPKYQRGYAWEKRHLEDFYNDLLYIDGGKYFMGIIILRETGTKRGEDFGEFEGYEVIDGQQRLTTICIFVKSAIEILENRMGEKTELKEYINYLQEIYVKKGSFLKLELLGEDERFFRNYMIEGQECSETITPTQKKLKEVKKFFKKKLSNLSTDKIKNLLLKLEKTSILVYPVKEKSDGILMLETINDRGKPLSNLEKTKSFLMSLVCISYGSMEFTEEELSKLSDEERQRISKKRKEMDRLLTLIDEKFGKIYRHVEVISENYGENFPSFKEEDIQSYHWESMFHGSCEKGLEYIDALKKYFHDLMLNDKDKMLEMVKNYVVSLEHLFYGIRRTSYHL